MEYQARLWKDSAEARGFSLKRLKSECWGKSPTYMLYAGKKDFTYGIPSRK